VPNDCRFGVCRRPPRALAGERHSLERVGTCEDTGSPWPILYATVNEWRTRSMADEYFMRQGWLRSDAGLVNPSSEYVLNSITSRTANSTSTFVTAEFSEVLDN
jgi:hypothetical protein